MTEGYQNPNAENQQEYPCDQCGALLRFRPGTRSIVCEHCGHGNEIASSSRPVVERDLREALERAIRSHETEESLNVQCSACAAQYSLQANEHAGSCPFCGTDIVVDSSSCRQIKPDALLPFSIEDKDAVSAVQRWLKNLWFAPSKLVQITKGRGDFTGIYMPYWTYDSQTRTNYRGQRGTNYTVQVPYTTVVDGKRVQATRTEVRIKWQSVRGRVQRFFDDVLVPGSNSLPRKILSSVGTWDLKNLESYQKDYLIGFRAESYQIGVEDGFTHAKEIMDSVIYNDIRRDIGGDHQRIHSVNTEHSDMSFKHILLPLWISAFRFKNKTYRLAVNGQTGEVYGERPYSGWKIFFAVLAGLTVLAIAAGLYAISKGMV